MEVNLDDTLIKTEEILTIFTESYDFDLPAYSKFSENRVAVVNLANLVNSNDAFDTSVKNIHDDLVQLDTHLNKLSLYLLLIYEEGNKFFLTFEKSFSEWEKLAITNQYNTTLFELMRNQTSQLYNILSATVGEIEGIKKFVPSTKAGSEFYIENEGILLFQWINHWNISLWCNTSIIKKCEYELFRIKKIVAFLENSESDLRVIILNLQSYFRFLYLNHISGENVKVNQVTKDLKPIIDVIKSGHTKFLMNQDVSQNHEDNNSPDITKNVEFKSKLVGKGGCREFVTRFASPPIFRGVNMSKRPPFLQNIKIGSGLFIDSLTFEWSDNISFKYGGNGGGLRDFNLDKDEVVTWVKIYTYTSDRIGGLEFRTNKWKTTGMLGKPISDPTILEAPRGYEIVGLYGGFDNYICGIGILYSKIETD